MPPRRSPLIAAHEAGHAAVAMALGIEVSEVRLTPRRANMSGYARAWVLADGSQRLHEALIDAAGPAADVLSGRYSTDAALRRPPYRWTADYESIARLGFSRAERELLVRQASRMLEGECAAAWRALTEALIESDLTGDAVRAIAFGAKGSR